MAGWPDNCTAPVESSTQQATDHTGWAIDSTYAECLFEDLPDEMLRGAVEFDGFDPSPFDTLVTLTLKSVTGLTRARAAFHDRLANLFLRLQWREAAANAVGRALRIRPDDADLRFRRAWILLELPPRRAEAIAAFASLMKSSPSAFGYYLLAGGLQKEHLHQEAVHAFGEAARLDSKANRDPDFSYNYGLSLSAVGRFEDAAEAFRNAALLNPSDGEAWGFLGLTFAAIGQWADAVPSLERAMRLSPCVLHGLHLAETFQWLNRLDDAERVLRECLVIDSRSTEVKEALALVLADQDRYEQALILAQDVCAVKPVAVSSRVALAGVLRCAGQLEAALREANAAAEAYPSDPKPQAALASIHVEMNDGAAALTAFDRVRSQLEQSAERPSVGLQVWCTAGRGNALSVLGRHEEAMSAFEEALRGDPEYFKRWPEGGSHYGRSLRETQRGKQES